MEILGLINLGKSENSSSHSPKLGLGSQTRRFFSLMVVLLALGAGFSAFNSANAQNDSREYPIKAAFLYNFIQFTQWPTNTFSKPDAPFVIGVLGTDPFGIVLDVTFRDETLNSHKIILQRYRQVNEATNCHLLFISESETRQAERILTSLKGKPILTVCDTDASAFHDVIVRLGMVNNRIRFTINTDSLKDSSLTVSSKLLRVAEIATAGKK